MPLDGLQNKFNSVSKALTSISSPSSAKNFQVLGRRIVADAEAGNAIVATCPPPSPRLLLIAADTSVMSYRSYHDWSQRQMCLHSRGFIIMPLTTSLRTPQCCGISSSTRHCSKRLQLAFFGPPLTFSYVSCRRGFVLLDLFWCILAQGETY